MRWFAPAIRHRACHLHQAHFLLQQQHFEQVAHGFGVADDVVANGLVAKALAHHAGGFKNGQLALGVAPYWRPPRAAAARRSAA
jgi:hypothetical protein